MLNIFMCIIKTCDDTEQGRCIKSRKTRLVRWGSVPVYDDVFVVTIPKDLLSQIAFRLEVIARGRLGDFFLLV